VDATVRRVLNRFLFSVYHEVVNVNMLIMVSFRGKNRAAIVLQLNSGFQ